MIGHQLEVKNLYKKYARREVVNDVSFSVKGGEIVGLLGPNGAGKTTCFYITCGLVRSSRGEVKLDCPGFLLSNSFWIASKFIVTPAGKPSIIPPIAKP